MNIEKIRKVIISEDRFKELLIKELKSDLIERHSLINSIEFSLVAQSDSVYLREYEITNKTDYSDRDLSNE